LESARLTLGQGANLPHSIALRFVQAIRTRRASSVWLSLAYPCLFPVFPDSVVIHIYYKYCIVCFEVCQEVLGEIAKFFGWLIQGDLLPRITVLGNN